MVIDCDNLKQSVQSFSLVKSCDVIKSGALRIATPFHYSDGSNIDLFLDPTPDLFGNLILSDLGQTAAYVADLQFDLLATRKRQLIIEDICHSLGVSQKDGIFQISIEPRQLSDLPQAIVRLAQACIRASDLVFTQRLKNAGSFQEEIEEFLASNRFHYESEISLIGEFDKEVKV
ncbi:MAG: DUF1828 domain-containing protein, partial [Methylococcales bacterium]